MMLSGIITPALWFPTINAGPSGRRSSPRTVASKYSSSIHLAMGLKRLNKIFLSPEMPMGVLPAILKMPMTPDLRFDWCGEAGCHLL